jgi:hypothetical protein
MPYFVMAQRNLEELIDADEPAWPLVREWLAAARNPVQVLPGDRVAGERTLLRLQVTTRSPLGAVALEAGGLLFDHGWLRLLGSGAPRMRGNLLTWNGLVDDAAVAPLHGALIVAHDILGGFFAVNGGAFTGNSGNVFYFAPDTLEWEDLSLGYASFIHWACSTNLASFYGDTRWRGWEADARQLNGDEGFSVYPPQWAHEGGPVAERSRRAVPMTELWNMQYDIAPQLRDLPSGPVRSSAG